MSCVDEREGPYGCERKSSIETEPRTLYERQLQEAREAAIDILNSKEPEEALSIFSQRQTVSTDGRRYHPPVFAVEDEMQPGLSDEQATETKVTIEEGNDDYQHFQHKNRAEEQEQEPEQNFVINNCEEKDELPFTERSRVIVEAASAPV